MTAFLFDFEWDPNKAHANLTKHSVDFESAAEVFRDPLATTIPDDEHSTTEVRWVTLGKDSRNRYVLVVHTIGREYRPRQNYFRAAADEDGASQLRGTRMKPEYDFSKGERGKFYRPNVEIRLPIYLDAEVQRYLAERAADKGVPLGEMVNGLLKRDIQIIESAK